MVKNIRNVINTAILGCLMYINSPYTLENVQFDSFFNKKDKNGLENVINEEDLKNIPFEEAITLYPSTIQKKLLDNALTNNTHSGVDSVIKFVPQETIKDYLQSLEKPITHEYAGLTKLEALTKTGEEIAHDRFKSSRHNKKALTEYARHLGITPGAYGNNLELSQFINLYKDDIMRTAEKYDLDPSLLASLSAHESRGRTFTASRTGALGAFGLTKYIYGTQSVWTDGMPREPINPFNTVDAMDRAADFLSTLIKKYESWDDNKHTLALIAYNQGETQVNKAIRIARKEGRNPLDIVDYKTVLTANNTTHMSNILESDFESNKTQLIAQEGRNYPSKIYNEMRKIEKIL